MDDNFTLRSYESLLSTALKSGYSFWTFNATIERQVGRKSCLLRHDIDSELLGCNAILDAERELGVQATYFVMLRSTSYNIFCVEGRRVLDRIQNEGHQIGLHFMGEGFEHSSEEELVSAILADADVLRRETGQKVDAVTFHQPTAKMLKRQLFVPGMINGYNGSQLADFHYISDSNMNWRGQNPFQIFREAIHDRIQLLIHPMWWTSCSMPLIQKWHSVLDLVEESIVNHWCAREATLSDRNALTQRSKNI